MKNLKFILISFLIMFSVILIPHNIKSVNAELEINNKDYSVCLSGYGQYEVKATIAELKVATTACDSSSNIALEKANANMQDLLNKISEIISVEDKDCIEFMIPIFKSNKMCYEYTKVCTLETTDIDNIEKIISLIEDNNAQILGIKYKAEDINEACSKAILNAMENAQNVANGINENLKVKKVMEKCVYYNDNTNNLDNNIIVNAKVFVFFECDNCENDESNLDNNNNIITESKSIKTNKIIPLKKEA